jgi:hypothetical protein
MPAFKKQNDFLKSRTYNFFYKITSCLSRIFKYKVKYCEFLINPSAMICNPSTRPNSYIRKKFVIRWNNPRPRGFAIRAPPILDNS